MNSFKKIIELLYEKQDIHLYQKLNCILILTTKN